MKIYTAPEITIVSRPSFTMPVQLPVEWEGEASDGERLSEYAGRICYMSQANPARRTTAEYLGNIKKQGHGSVFEHANYSVLIEGVSRSLTHELVRHRAGFAYSQLSQRYVDEQDCAFVAPPAILDTCDDDGESWTYRTWYEQVLASQRVYTDLSNELFEKYSYIEDRVHRRKTAREAARSVLPNATETKLIATANVRAWRTMLELRSSEGADREIRRFAVACIKLLTLEAPGFFGDFEIYTGADGNEAGRAQFHKV